MGQVRALLVSMKLNISCPETGSQKSIDIDDDKKLLPFFDKRISQEVSLDSLGDEFVGYRARISGGNDKQGFPMMQGVLTPERVLHLVLVKRGEAQLPGITDEEKPLRLGPKRATKIRKLFSLTDEDDVRKFVLRRKITTKNGKEYNKAPKIQRLVTPRQLSRQRHRVALKRG